MANLAISNLQYIEFWQLKTQHPQKNTKKKNTVFVAILNLFRQKEKNIICRRCKNHENQPFAFGCGTSPLRSVVGTSSGSSPLQSEPVPVPVPWNRKQSLCYSALLFLLLLRLLRLLLVGVCQILTLHMCLYQQLLFLCPTSLPGVVELVFTVFGCVVSTSFCCCCCCCCC